MYSISNLPSIVPYNKLPGVPVLMILVVVCFVLSKINSMCVLLVLVLLFYLGILYKILQKNLRYKDCRRYLMILIVVFFALNNIKTNMREHAKRMYKRTF